MVMTTLFECVSGSIKERLQFVFELLLELQEIKYFHIQQGVFGTPNLGNKADIRFYIN